MKLFNTIDIETSSACNRVCRTCLRNMYPDRARVRPLFEQNLMPMDTIAAILDECRTLDYKDKVCLCHWNEPLMDPRIVEIAKLAKSYGRFFVYFVTNGDFLTAELAAQLDGVLDRIIVSVYDGDRREYARKLKAAFKTTSTQVKGDHRIAHYNPNAVAIPERPCRPVPRRLIINHAGEYLLCCEDLVGEFYLGKFPDLSLKEYWFGGKHERILQDLAAAGGRKKYPYCATCPMDFAAR